MDWCSHKQHRAFTRTLGDLVMLHLASKQKRHFFQNKHTKQQSGGDWKAFVKGKGLCGSVPAFLQALGQPYWACSRCWSLLPLCLLCPAQRSFLFCALVVTYGAQHNGQHANSVALIEEASAHISIAI